jgi:pyruvate-formate lyase-activating enzyme
LILFIEPISKNIDMYVPAYPLPIMEIASFITSKNPELEIGIISIPMDYGLPINQKGREQIYRQLQQDIFEIKPKGVGISCTAISQAQEVIHLCELIKEYDPSMFIFLGGYFPTIYYEEIFHRTSAVDLIVVGEGELPALKIAELLEKGKNPINEDIPNLAFKEDGQIRLTKTGIRFDLKEKGFLNLELLKCSKQYGILPYSFSRGCPYRCNFCMEDNIRPLRREVPSDIVRTDLTNLSSQSNSRTLLVSDALFKSFDMFPFIESLGMKVNFETRCDVLKLSIIPKIADVCGILALGFESASYNTLRRMNKVRDRSHYEKYISNAKAIFRKAVENEIPVMIFMIAGYPGDTEKDLQDSLIFAKDLAKYAGPGGHVFKIGECRAYPKTKLYNQVLSLPDVVFDNDGVFGDNIIREPSRGVNFETVLAYMDEVFSLSNDTPKLHATIINMMPFFRLPARALQDDIIPDTCFKDDNRLIFDVQGESLLDFRNLAPQLKEKYRRWMSGQRSTRNLSI